MLHITQAETDEHRQHVRELFWEYLTWANAMLGREFGIDFDIRSMLEHDMEELRKFAPPKGRLLLAYQSAALAGCACLRSIGPDIGEIKRWYVRPANRGTGIGRALLVAVIEEARQIGYKTIRLDSARFMNEAHALYQAVGFQPIAPYPQSEIPEEFWPHWVFMELSLSEDASAHPSLKSSP